MRRRPDLLVVLVVLSTVLPSCVVSPVEASKMHLPADAGDARWREMKRGWWTQREEREARGPHWRESTLFFGLSRQSANGTGSDEISDAEFYRFVSEVVTPLFPDGLTILDAHGQYLNHHGVLIKEKSKYMVIFHPDEPAYHDKLESLWRNYTEQFNQESVLITSTVTDFCFNDECLGTPIPDLETEFESLRKQQNQTLELLRAMEARLASLESGPSKDEGSSLWIYAGIAAASALAAGVVSFVIYRMWHRRRRVEEQSPLLGH